MEDTQSYEGRPAIATPPSSNEPRINDRIRAREVRLVGPDGSQIGIKPLPEALTMARELDLDLVEVADKADPPVCRIMDYGKYKYEAAQKAKESRKKSTNVSVKEMKYRPKIGAGDFHTKTRKVAQFLGEGHKVKVTIMFRGRETAHPELGRRILDNVAEEVVNVARVEVIPKLDGRNMIMVLAPDKRAQAAYAKQVAEAEAEALAEAGGSAPEETSETVPTEAVARSEQATTTEPSESAEAEPAIDEEATTEAEAEEPDATEETET